MAFRSQVGVNLNSPYRNMAMDGNGHSLFHNGLTNIRRELYEAADVDGATSQKLIYITIPLLRPVIVFVLTLNALGGYQLFTEPYILWMVE